MTRDITKIVITGGPCAGKTTAMSWIANALPSLGYKVLFVTEAATECLTGGITAASFEDPNKLQYAVAGTMLNKEKIFGDAAEDMLADKILIVCDRGLLDNKAYATEEFFAKLCRDLGGSESEFMARYDAVFHLVTAANGAIDFYTLGNNNARSETPELAIQLDNATIAAWTGHPHLFIIDNSTGFEEKMKRLLREITNFLGEPAPLIIARKFLIKYPDIKLLESNPQCRKVEIEQSYLIADGETEIRLRKMTVGNDYTCYLTTRILKGPGKAVETEIRLTKRQYREYEKQVDHELGTIKKTRYYLTYDNQYFEIDIYPFYKSKAILEIKLSYEDQEIRFPDYIEVIREVTNEDKYSRISEISKRHGK